MFSLLDKISLSMEILLNKFISYKKYHQIYTIMIMLKLNVLFSIPVFTVEKIVTHRVGMGGLEYFVKWKGYSQKYNSWEPEENMMCKGILLKYQKKNFKVKNE